MVANGYKWLQLANLTQNSPYLLVKEIFYYIKTKMAAIVDVRRYYLAPEGVTSAPEGVARYCFHTVCLSVCVSVCPANILVFYFSAIRKKYRSEIYTGYL